MGSKLSTPFKTWLNSKDNDPKSWHSAPLPLCQSVLLCDPASWPRGMLESDNLFFGFHVSILGKIKNWVHQQIFVSPLKMIFQVIYPTCKTLSDKVSFCVVQQSLCLPLEAVVLQSTEEQSRGREGAREELGERDRERERGRDIEEGGFKEVDWGEIACQALWKPQADWAGNQPTIPVQTSVLERSLCLHSLKSVSLFLWGEQHLDKQ